MPAANPVYVSQGAPEPTASVICAKDIPAVNVYSLQIDYMGSCADPGNTTNPQCQTRTIDTSSPESWTLTIYNDSSQNAIFGVFIADTAAETEGPDIWLRDNAIVDPSGHHTLNNPANLDVSLAPTPNEWWKSPAIRFTDQYGNPTKNPVGGQPNNVYVKVRNFGTMPVSSVTVEAFWTNAAAGLPPYGDPRWNPMGSQTIAVGINPGEDAETGAFTWNVPPAPAAGQINHFCVFARVKNSAGALDAIDFSSSVVDVVSPTNTNATHWNVVILTATDPVPSGPTPFFFAPVKFFITNPFKKDIYVDVSLKGLPAVARTSRISFKQREGDKIRLQGVEKLPMERKSKEAVSKDDGTVRLGIIDTERISVGGLHLKPGEQREIEVRFGLAEPMKAGFEASVDAVQSVEGKVIGGMTYVIAVEKQERQKGEWSWILIALIAGLVIMGLARLIMRPKQ